MCIFPVSVCVCVCVCVCVLPAVLLLGIIGRYSAARTLQNRELSSVLCNGLEWWDAGMGGMSKSEGIYAYIQLIHLIV